MHHAPDRGIEIKSCCRWRRGRVTKVDSATICVTAKPALQTCRFVGGRSFYPIVTLFYATRYCLGTSPKCRRKATLPSKRRNYLSSKRLTPTTARRGTGSTFTAISAGDKVQPVQRQYEISKRAVARNGKGCNHMNRIAGRRSL